VLRFPQGAAGTDQLFHIYWADGASHEGDPVDAYESERIAWVPVDEVRRLIAGGEVHDGLSLTGLLWVLALVESGERVVRS
jgi:hypothetical protein